MSDQTQENQIQIPLVFPYVEGNIPAYSNTLIVNPSPEGVIIDFGFFDPLLARQMQEQWQKENLTEETEIKPVKVQSVSRVFIHKLVAEQLIQQLQAILSNVNQ